MKDLDLKTIGNRLKSVYFFGSRPLQDWPKIVTVAGFVLAVLLVWSYFFHQSVQSEIKKDFSSSQITPAKGKEMEIKDILDKYKAKEEKFNSLN